MFQLQLGNGVAGGGIVGHCNGTISNCCGEGEVWVGCDGIAEYAGGILGESDAGASPVVHCINSFTLTGRHAADYQVYGGIIRNGVI